MKNLIQRSITGFLFVLFVIGSILLGEFSFFALFAIATMLTLNEYYRISQQKGDTLAGRISHICGGLYIFTLISLQLSGATPLNSMQLFVPYLIYFIYMMCNQLYAKADNPVDNWARAFFGHIYIALPLALLNHIAYLPIDGEVSYTPVMLLALFAFIWANDTGAYIVGVSIGKHRLFERISPKKSWEGFFGGLLFALIASLVFSHYSDLLNLYEWLGFGLVVALAATFGDLCESLFKRTYQVKDSGTILPGHGGLLDRLDSVLLASPAAVIYLAYFL